LLLRGLQRLLLRGLQKLLLARKGRRHRALVDFLLFF
jgi:hypothetical protein